MRDGNKPPNGFLLLIVTILFLGLMPVLFAVFNIFAIPMVAGPSYVLGKALDDWWKSKFR